YTKRKVEALMKDEGIVRNRLKIEGAIDSARAWLEMKESGAGFGSLLWDFVGGRPIVNRYKSIAEIPAETELSRAISKELKSRGFKFCGPTIVYAFMQATGMVNDHLVTCPRHAACARLGRAPSNPHSRADLRCAGKFALLEFCHYAFCCAPSPFRRQPFPARRL